MNKQGTDGDSLTLVVPGSLEDTRRGLIALRVKHGANTPIGHRASNAIEQLQNGHLAGLQKSVAELARLTANQ